MARDDALLHIVIKLEHLGLEHYTIADLYKARSVATIKARAALVLESPYWCKLELGCSGQLHLHAIGFSRPHVTHHAAPVRDLEKLAKYLSKPTASPKTAGALEAYRSARQKLKGKRTPRTSWTAKIPNG